MGLCTFRDEFLQEKLVWFVKLSNGETIYQDDDRPGEAEPKTWIRLKEYINKNSLSITEFYINFCSHTEEAADPEAPGYYFSQAIDAVTAAGIPDYCRRYYLIGRVIDINDDGTYNVHVSRWMVPEIIKVGSEVRSAKPDDDRLIINGKRT